MHSRAGRGRGTDGSSRDAPASVLNEECDMTWKWSNKCIDVKDVIKDLSIPAIVRLHNDDYGNFGAGSQLDVHQPLLLYSVRRCSKVLAANVEWDEKRGVYEEKGTALVIPLSYPGWFYLIESDWSHKSCTGWTSIKDVASSQTSTFLSGTALACYHLTRQSHLGELIYTKDTIRAGEILAAQDRCSETIDGLGLSQSCLSWLCGRSKAEMKYLRCTDTIGRELMIPFDAKGEFHKVRDDGGSFDDHQVFQLHDVVDSLSTLTTVKLVCGQAPSAGCPHFTGVLRLDEEPFLDEVVIACTLGGDRPTMLELPTDSSLRLIPALNAKELMREGVVRDALRYCTNNIDTYVTTIKVTQNVYADHVPSTSGTEKGESRTTRRPTSALPRLPRTAYSEEADGETAANTHAEDSDASLDYCSVYESDEFDSDVEKEETVYETIPPEVDLISSTKPQDLMDEPRPAEDEDGYLAPLSIRDSSIQSGAGEHDYVNTASIDRAVANDLTTDGRVRQDASRSVEDTDAEAQGAIIAYETSDSGSGARYITSISVTASDTAPAKTASKGISGSERVDVADATDQTSDVAILGNAIEISNALGEVECIPETSTHSSYVALAHALATANSAQLERPSEDCICAAGVESLDMKDAADSGSGFDRQMHGDLPNTGSNNPNDPLILYVNTEHVTAPKLRDERHQTLAETDSVNSSANPDPCAGTALADPSGHEGHFEPVQNDSNSKNLDVQPDIDVNPADTETEAGTAFDCSNRSSEFDTHGDLSTAPVFHGSDLPDEFFSSDATTEYLNGLNEFEHTVNSTFASAESSTACHEDILLHWADDASFGDRDGSAPLPVSLDTEDLIQDANDACFNESCNTEILNAATADALLKHRLANADSSRLDAFLDDSLLEYHRLSSASADDPGPESSSVFNGADVAAEAGVTTPADDSPRTETDIDAFLEKVFSRATMGQAICSPAMERRRFHSLTTESIGYASALPHQRLSTRSLSQNDFYSNGLNLADEELIAIDSGTGAISFDAVCQEAGAIITQTGQQEVGLGLKDDSDGSTVRSDSPSLSSLYRQIRSPRNSAASCPKCSRKLSPTDSGVCSSARRSSSDASTQECHECACRDIQPGSAGSDLSWSWHPPEDISFLSVEEVALSLRYIGMKEPIVQRFCEEQIDGRQMADFDADLLSEGFPQLNALDKKKILDFVAGWRPKKLLPTSNAQGHMLLGSALNEYHA